VRAESVRHVPAFAESPVNVSEEFRRTVKPGYNEFDGTRENITYNQKFLITKVTL